MGYLAWLVGVLGPGNARYTEVGMGLELFPLIPGMELGEYLITHI